MLYCCIVVLLPTLKKASKTSLGKGGFFNASALGPGIIALELNPG